MPETLITFLTAMTPVGELRASIPLGLVHFGQPWWLVLGLSLAGNLLPVSLLLLVLNRGGAWLERLPYPAGPLLRWRAERLRLRYGSTINRYGPVAIAAFVAVPLPFTGAWTGAMVVWALHVPFWKGLAAITAGVSIAGVVVTALSVAGIELFIRLD